jgi:acyl-CoA hydrolase
MHTILDVFPMAFYDKEFSGKLQGVSWFTGSGARTAINGGYGGLMPCYYRDMPSLFTDYVDMDAYCAVVSPMDKHGYFSTGATGSNSFAMIRKAKRIFLEVNENMPRVASAPIIHI